MKQLHSYTWRRIFLTSLLMAGFLLPGVGFTIETDAERARRDYEEKFRGQQQSDKDRQKEIDKREAYRDYMQSFLAQQANRNANTKNRNDYNNYLNEFYQQVTKLRSQAQQIAVQTEREMKKKFSSMNFEDTDRMVAGLKPGKEEKEGNLIPFKAPSQDIRDGMAGIDAQINYLNEFGGKAKKLNSSPSPYLTYDGSDTPKTEEGKIQDLVQDIRVHAKERLVVDDDAVATAKAFMTQAERKVGAAWLTRDKLKADGKDDDTINNTLALHLNLGPTVVRNPQSEGDNSPVETNKKEQKAWSETVAGKDVQKSVRKVTRVLDGALADLQNAKTLLDKADKMKPNPAPEPLDESTPKEPEKTAGGGSGGGSPSGGGNGSGDGAGGLKQAEFPTQKAFPTMQYNQQQPITPEISWANQILGNRGVAPVNFTMPENKPLAGGLGFNPQPRNRKMDAFMPNGSQNPEGLQGNRTIGEAIKNFAESYSGDGGMGGGGGMSIGNYSGGAPSSGGMGGFQYNPRSVPGTRGAGLDAVKTVGAGEAGGSFTEGDSGPMFNTDTGANKSSIQAAQNWYNSQIVKNPGYKNNGKGEGLGPFRHLQLLNGLCSNAEYRNKITLCSSRTTREGNTIARSNGTTQRRGVSRDLAGVRTGGVSK